MIIGLTSSDNAKTKEENDATQVTAQAGFVWAIYGNHTWVAFFLWLCDDYHIVV